MTYAKPSKLLTENATTNSTTNAASNTLIKSLHASWSKTPLARDKADTLLLLAACLFVLLPHFLEMAWWVTVVCASLMLWRGWITLTGRRLPASWVLVPIAALAMAGVYTTFHTFFGREAGVTMLALLLSCKLLEMHAKRDLYVVIFLNFFLILSSFFYSQTIGSALLSIIAVVLLLTAQLSFQYTGAIPSLWQRFKLAARLFGYAVPLTIVCFFLFPRIQGPLWSLPGDANKAKSGMSDTMSPGNISNLALSDEIAFRAKFTGAAPSRNLLYWRGIVLSQFDGHTWSHEEAPGAVNFPDLFQGKGSPIRQQIILEPSNQRWLFALDIPVQAAQFDTGRDETANANSRFNAQLELFNNTPINARLRYDVSSYPRYQLKARPDRSELDANLDLPDDYNPRTLQFAKELKQRTSSDPQRVQEILNWLHRESFSYTLEPPLLGRDSVDEFLFGTRAGFCEHYAGSFVVLMRAMQIPARVVTGYQGGLPNSVDGFLEVRQSDAHAWAEVWLAEQGWVRIDPTAAVAPERISKDLSSTQVRGGLAGITQAISNNSLLLHLRMRWNAINNSWNQWVLNYSQERQFDFLRSLGLSEVDWPQITALFFAVAALAIALIAWPLMRDRPSISALERVYQQFCQKLARMGHQKFIHEGPLDYQKRLKLCLNTEQFIAAQQFLSLYAALKYEKKPPAEMNSLKQLKQCLARLV